MTGRWGRESEGYAPAGYSGIVSRTRAGEWHVGVIAPEEKLYGIALGIMGLKCGEFKILGLQAHGLSLGQKLREEEYAALPG